VSPLKILEVEDMSCVAFGIWLFEASDDISQRPSKRIRKALQEQEEEQLEPKELQKPYTEGDARHILHFQNL
jgi:hypothetical protein